MLNQGEIISNVLNISELAPDVRLPIFVVTDDAKLKPFTALASVGFPTLVATDNANHPAAILRTTSEQAANPTVPVTKAAAPKPPAQSKRRPPSEPDSGLAEQVPSAHG